MKCIHLYLLTLGLHFQTYCQFLSLLEELEMKNPVIIGDMIELKTKDMFDTTKHVMKLNQTICVNTKIWNGSIEHSPGIVLSKNTSKIILQINKNQRKPWIIVGSMPEIYSQIDKPLYFLENTTLWEQYRFKSFEKRNSLGSFLHNKFIWDVSKKTNILERRGNFENLTLIGMTDAWATSTFLPKEWEKMAKVSTIVKDAYEVSTLLY